MRYRAMTIGLMLAVAGAGAALANDIYKWTDEDGNVHFGDVPAGEAPVRMDIQSRPTDPERIREVTQAMAEQRIRAAESKAAAESEQPTEEQQRLEREDRQRKCEAYKANLDTYLTNRRLYNLQPDGEREYLSDEQMAAARELAAQKVTEFCS